MSLIDILLTIVIISSFCLGLRTILSEGQLLHFIREPFEYGKSKRVINFLNNILLEADLTQDEMYGKVKQFSLLSKRIVFALKPVIICVVCFPSVWGTLIFYFLHGFRLELLICIISSTFIIKVINDKVEF